MSRSDPASPAAPAVTAPAELGRSVVVGPGQSVPSPWATAPRIVVDAGVVADPAQAVAELHRAWLARDPMAIELAVDASALRHPTVVETPPHSLDPGLDLLAERLHFLVWANSYDARGGELVWWHGRKAVARFAEEGVTSRGAADIALTDGRAAFVDGGPPHPPDLPDGTPVLHRWNAEAASLMLARHGPPEAVLAPDQLEAVLHRAGPARVIAPAGSGKTRVLTERLRHLIADRGVAPATVTVLAYNVKAAEELRARCAGAFSAGTPRIATLNSIGLAICNDHGGAGRQRVLTERDARGVVESVFEIRHRANTDTVVPYLEALSTVRMALVPPAEAEELHPDAAGLADRFDRYRAALADAGAVDFDEQIYRAIEILLTDPAARLAAQARCRHLLVDELQDLTPAHLLLIRLLSAPAFDCFGVGDDDQVLYGYSGATPEYLIDYEQYFPGARPHALEVNYRCPPPVVDAAVHLLAHNRRRVDKVIRAAPGRTSEPAALHIATAPPEGLAAEVVTAVAAWEQTGVGRDDMVVLARVNSALLPVLVGLRQAGVPVESSLGVSVLSRTGIRTALAYLRMGTDPGRIARRDIEQTIRRPSRGIAPNVVGMLTGRSHTSVPDIRRLAGAMRDRDGPKLRALADDIERVAQACGDGTAAALRVIRDDVGLGATMDVLDGSRDEPDRSTHQDDLAALVSVAAHHPDPATFERWLRGILEGPTGGELGDEGPVGEPPGGGGPGGGGPADGGAPADGGPAVLLSSVHRIKGREWSRVVVFGASAGLFPHRLSDDVEGERRVFHVAITRGRDEVLVLADRDAPSFFLQELDGSRVVRPEPALPERATDLGGARDAARAGRTRGSSPGAASSPGNAVTSGPVERTAASEGLRAWRTEEARRLGMPPYIVLSDRHLEAIVVAAPQTLAELARCKGIGPAKLERFGDQILAVLAADREG